MKVLQVAYPYEPVMPESAGGSEQVLALLDRELTRLGHQSVVVARAGSRVAGRLVASAAADSDFPRSCAHHDATIRDLLARERFDVIHNQGYTLQHWAETLGAPLLTTLHLARRLYPGSPIVERPDRFYALVSRSQRGEYLELPPDRLPVVPNGIDLDRFRPADRRGDYALAIGRICPEKGFHHAIAAARAAGVRLVVVGKVYRFEAHKRYFDEAIRPALGHGVDFVESPTTAVKCDLLARARCVLIPSEIEETSSLVAMEAAASGAPVICFRRGALPEVVEDGVTGLIVDDVGGMVEAIGQVGQIDGRVCRQHAEARFSGRAMAECYLKLYRRILR